MTRNLGEPQVEKQDIRQGMNRPVAVFPSPLQIVGCVLSVADPDQSSRRHLLQHELQREKIGVIVLGHEDIEPPGMGLLFHWLKPLPRNGTSKFHNGKPEMNLEPSG